MEAELYAAAYGLVEGIGAQSIMEDLGCTTQLHLGVDSSAAAGLMGKAKHVDTQWLWVQQEIRRTKVFLKKIPGASNAADLMTKALSQAVIDEHMKRLNYKFL